MSTAKVEDAQSELPIASSNLDEAKNTEEEAPASEIKDVNGRTEPRDIEKKSAKKENNGVRTYEDGVLKTTAREDLKDSRKNNKYDPSILPETDDAQLIRNQVEFYFGDSNLPGDKFMWNATDGTNNLPIKIETLCTFGRMKRFRPISAVVAALRESDFLDVTGPEGLEEVKRKYPYDPTVPRSKTESRSIYAKGFGDEEPSSQFDIEAFFAPYGPTNSVRLRRTAEKLFKGSVFVEFQDEETAEAFLKLDPKPLWKGKHVLKIIPKKQYMEEKADEIKDGKIDPGPSWPRGRGKGRGARGGNRGQRNDRGRGGHDRGDRDPDDWKKRREDDRANGFRDDRNRRDNKGGRGRGRRDDRGSHNHDRNREREEREEKIGYESTKVENDKKRSREDDNEEGAPAKKLDSKSEGESSKSNAREDGGEEAALAKKVESKSDVNAESS